MAEDLGERTEQPTTRRLHEARRRGQVVRSANLSAVVLLSAGIVLLFVFGGDMLEGLAALVRRWLAADSLGSAVDGDALSAELLIAGAETARIIIPALAIMAVIAAGEQIVQVGWFISLDPLVPRLSRFSPIAGVRRLFSRRSLIRGLIDIIKLAVIAAVAFVVIRPEYDRIVALPLLTVGGAFVETCAIIARVAAWTLFILLVIGVVDRLYQKWQHNQDLRMTRQEVKDERKSTEGDLETKARRMRLAREIIRQKLRVEVPKADVIVTNPTHFAVALRYDSGTMSAPRVVAKGVDYLALQIRLIAAAHGVPVVERPPLARALYHAVDVGREIPAEQYEAVAEVLAYVYRLEGRMAS